MCLLHKSTSSVILSQEPKMFEMKMRIALDIPKPCTADWNDFKPTFAGGFCAACQKEVVDFTKMGEDEIIALLRQPPAHMCGRFRPDQLKEYHVGAIPMIQPGWGLLKAGALSLLLVSATEQAVAGPAGEGSSTEMVEPNSAESIKNPEGPCDPNFSIVAGIVKDKLDNSPIPGVNIVLKGTEIGTITDADGRFRFPVALKEGDVLVFSFIGYTTEELTIGKQQADVIELSLTMDACYTLGELSINQIYEPHQSRISKWWGSVKRIL